MRTITLTLGEIFDLSSEINGSNNMTGDRGTKGLMREKLPVFVKFWINDLKKTIEDDVKSINEIRNEALTKYGEQVGGNGTVRFPDLEKLKLYNAEMTKLFDQKKEIKFNPFKLSTFADMVTDEPYNVFFRFVENDLPKEEEPKEPPKETN